MPNPNDKSRLAHRLAGATGCTIQYVYRCLKTGTLPRNPLVAKAWSQALALVARERSARLVGKAHRSGSCAQPTRRAVRKVGRS